MYIDYRTFIFHLYIIVVFCLSSITGKYKELKYIQREKKERKMEWDITVRMPKTK